MNDKREVKWFSFDGCSFETWDTEVEAKQEAEAALEEYSGEALDGWDEAADQVCWGLVLGAVVDTERRPVKPSDGMPDSVTEYVEKDLESQELRHCNICGGEVLHLGGAPDPSCWPSRKRS